MAIEVLEGKGHTYRQLWVIFFMSLYRCVFDIATKVRVGKSLRW
jgi:hypothetical protein